MNNLDRKCYLDAAAKYRKAWGGCRSDEGVIVFYGRDVQGWVNELRNPEHWKPGCVAVTAEGDICRAVGGNGRDGAREWRLINEDN